MGGELLPCVGLVELCCDADSRLTALAPEYGLTGSRITIESRFDTPAGRDEALALIAAAPGTDAWASLPCTSWCTWTFVNESRLGPAYCARLAWRHRQSLKMCGYAETCILRAQAQGGAGHFEWPRHCRGWQRSRVQRLLRAANLRRAAFDGCQFGVEAAPGLLAKKPWSVATSRPKLFEALNGRLCGGSHPHGRLHGRAATLSGHYTMPFCRCVLGAISSPCSGCAAASSELTCDDLPRHPLPATTSEDCSLERSGTPPSRCGPQQELRQAPAAKEPTGHRLLRRWHDAVMRSGTGFGRYAQAFVAGEVPRASTRARDLLPLPPLGASARGLRAFRDHPAADDLGSFVDLSSASLNWMYGLGRPQPVPRSATAVQRAALERIAGKIADAAALLDETDPSDLIEREAFERLVGTNRDAAYPDLAAAQVDLLEVCGQLDPACCLAPAAAAVIESASAMFPHGLGGAVGEAVFASGPREQYVALVRRQLRAGKVVLAGEALASGRVFAIGKKAGGKVREIWHGGQVTAAAERPPAPPALASPAGLADLEASSDRPLWTSGRDARIFFDQLRLCPSLRPYMGRPPVTLAELTDGIVAEQEPLTPEEVKALFELGCEVLLQWGSQKLTPLSAVWPMGFGWSSFVAQSYMLQCAFDAGYAGEQLVREEGALPADGQASLAIATDDVTHFVRASRAEMQEFVASPLASLDAVWKHRGVQEQQAKSYDLQLDATCLGIEIRGGVRLSPRAVRLRDLLEAGIGLLDCPVASPDQLASFGGMIQWHNLMARQLFSCLGDYYSFVRLNDPRWPRVVWSSVVGELAVNLSLLCFWMVDLTRPWLATLPVTDASQAYGFGLCAASLDPEENRRAAAHAWGSRTPFPLGWHAGGTAREAKKRC